MNVISAMTRPHFHEGCWCGPRECEDCGSCSIHRMVDLTVDAQPRMAAFSDQRIQIQMPV